MALNSKREESNSTPIVAIDGKLSDSELKEFGELLYGPFKEGSACSIIDLQGASEIGFVLLSAVYKINDELTAKGHTFVVVRKQGELKEKPPWGATYKFPLVVKNSREEAIAFGEEKTENPEAAKELEKEPEKERNKEEKQEKKEVAKPPLNNEMGAVAVFGGGKVGKPKAAPARVVPLGKGGAVPKGPKLEQLDLVTIFGRTFSLYGRNAVPILCTSLAMHLPLFVACAIMIAMVLLVSIKTLAVFPFVVIPLQLAVWSFFEAGIARVVANDQLGIESSTQIVLTHAWYRFGAVLGATLARYLAFCGLMVLAFIVSFVTRRVVGPGYGAAAPFLVIAGFAIWFLLAAFFTSDVASIENKGGLDAVTRSLDIIRGYYLHTIALVIALGLITGISSKALELGVNFAFSAMMPLFRGSKYIFVIFMFAKTIVILGTTFLTSLLASPVMFIGKTLLYFRSRVDKENLNAGTLSTQLSE